MQQSQTPSSADANRSRGEKRPAAISVIMINRNGGSYLEPAVRTCRAAIEAALPLEPRIEFVMVDNGSTDEPVPVITRALAGAPFAWRVVHEGRPGVNSARNAGIEQSSGDILLFTDSDLEFDAGWLRGYITAAHANPLARIFAGRVRVGKLEAPPPEWLAVEGPLVRTSIVVRCDYGDQVRVIPIDGVAGPVGPNMGFRRDIFAQFGMFDTRFGLRPGSLVPGAESEFFDRLSRAGMSFLYVPDAAAAHPIRRSQMTRAYFTKRLRGIGRATSRLRRIRGERPRQICGLTLYMVRHLAENIGAWAKAGMTGASPAARFHARGDVDIALGYLHEDFVAWRGSGRPQDPQPADAET
ncbi:MAG TPA: glycosyltransferase family 2 protein [Vicinamibacterales bacterium]|nr:glycosyltransferase family 2 protein [Vicinamibacterales bacterium]